MKPIGIVRHPAFWILLGGIAGGALSLPLLGYHFAWDQGVQSAIADKLLRGGVAYRDAWEFRPPLGFYAYYVSFLVFGRSEWAVRALEVICIAFTSGGLVRLGDYRFGSREAGLVAAVALPFLYLPFGHWHTAQQESYQMPFMIWALAVWPKPSEVRRVTLRCILSGSLMGIVMLAKTPAVLMAIVLLMERLSTDWKLQGRLSRFRLTLLTGAAMVPFPLAVAVYYTARGAGPELFEALFVFSPNYARYYSDFSLSWHAHKVPEMVFWCLPFFARMLLAVGMVRGFFFRRVETAWWGTYTLVALGEVIMQAKYIEYHLLVLIPFLAAGMGLAVVPAGASQEGEAPWRSLTRQTSFWIALLMTGVFLFESTKRVSARWSDLGLPPERQQTHQWVCWSYHQESAQLAQQIRELTRPDDSIFLWANHPLPYFLSDRRMAGPFSSIFLATAPWTGQGKVNSLIAQLVREAPRLVIVGANDELWQPGDSRKLLDRFPQMRDFLLDRYKRIEMSGNFQFWMLSE